MQSNKQTVVLTGATGYVDQLILRGLASRFREVRCLTRSPRKLNDLPSNCRIMKFDLDDQGQIDSAMTGASVAFYLVHSLNESNDFEQREYESATNFARSAARNNLSKIIYLGALAKESSNTSPHMRSRHKVGANTERFWNSYYRI